ncbi:MULTISPECIES: histidine kinase dimerization/phospho-acceptor domain-containing protein [Sphingomonas]|uniref:histidine kinase dimerization/phospho-acceptor domain-containing protein n=1 Tax=Sphingomonas TaxID=13687 RepID=UPI001269F7E5|nr:MULTISPECIES: histidine kinase dimerization/phospho-acceptor domain-containing protein [Sphingomonas]
MTVLGLNAVAPRDRVVQWRQLVELVARGAGETDPVLLNKALARIAEISPEVPETIRATAARAIAAPDLPLALLKVFVADRGKVAAPLLGAAELDDAAWKELRAAASTGTQAIIDTLHPREPARPPLKENAASAASSPRVAAGRLFQWECGPDGDIDWVDGIARGAVIGRSVRSDLRQRFDTMQPFVDEPLLLADDGELGGDWRWSGQPQFLPGSGRFAGYAGVARRVTEPVVPQHDPIPVLAAGLPADHGNLRELIHELRTPLTAIIGFGEVIEGQYLGPAHRAYRDRAGEIVRQARLLLAAVDDLDLAAKLRSASPASRDVTVLAELARLLDPRVTVEMRDDEVKVALEPSLAERLLRRFVAAVADAAGPEERLKLIVDRVDDRAVLAITRPEETLGLSDEAMLRGESVARLGFALRLVRGLAQIAGGSLDIEPEDFVLLLPAV